MKGIKILLLISIIFLLLLSMFLYNRYKTRRIDSAIGMSRLKIEEVLEYPGRGVKLDEESIDDVDERVKKVIQEKKLSSLHPVLKYSREGKIRKEIYWLLDGGEGYYVIEALNTGK